MNSLQFGLPQNRKRVYIVGLRIGAVFGDERSAISDIIADLRAVRARAKSWTDYLKEVDLESWGASETSETVPAKVCSTCCLTQACPAHVCTCPRCRKKSKGTAKCMWRATTKKFRAKHKKARNDFKTMLRPSRRGPT